MNISPKFMDFCAENLYFPHKERVITNEGLNN